MADPERLREAAAHRRLYAERKAAGLCPKCGRPRDTKFLGCSICIGRVRRIRARAAEVR